MIESKLEEAAISSLAEGLRCWKQAEAGNKEKYHFAVLHIARFFELGLKHAVYLMHPLLIYRKPHAANLEETQTINAIEAFHILRNATEDSHGDLEIDAKDDEELKRIKDIRNKIEHFFCDFEPEEVKDDISFFFDTFSQIVGDRTDYDITQNIPEDVEEIYFSLLDEE